MSELGEKRLDEMRKVLQHLEEGLKKKKEYQIKGSELINSAKTNLSFLKAKVKEGKQRVSGQCL